AGLGARPAVVDRFLAPWDSGYHPTFYRCVSDEIARRHPQLDLRPLSAVIDANGYPDDVLSRHADSLESLSLDNDSIDIVISNAVLEHLDEFPRAFRELYRVTRPGGCGMHQVDFRYHPSFDRPLEHLLQAPEEFDRQARECFRESGTCIRPHEMAALFRECGFREVEVAANMWASPG